MNEDSDECFKKAKEYNLSSSRTYQPALARQLFETAARSGHIEATRSLALMIHQGEGGPKNFKSAVALLAEGFFNLRDSEALDCLEEVLREEVEGGQTSVAGVNLTNLADDVGALKKLSDHVREDIRNLVR